MRRNGGIIEEIIVRANMETSFDAVVKGKKRKRSRQGRFLLAHRDETIDELTSYIAHGGYGVSDYREIDVYEHRKQRTIQVLTMKDRIAVHAVMTVVDEYLRKRFIRTTAASIKKRGMHDLMYYVKRDIANDPVGTRYCYKMDVRKFYESVDQQLLTKCVIGEFKDEKLLNILRGFITMLPKGISIGLRSSQGLGNLFLSKYLDHHFKDILGVRYYYRYCDDIVMLSHSKKELWKLRNIIHKKAQEINLVIKPNERVFPTANGIDFLGYVIYPDYVLLRKRIKQTFAEKMHRVKSEKRRRELIGSFYGMAKHANCANLFYKLTGKEMKSFKELNVTHVNDDGKKKFRGAKARMREVVNQEIVVLDAEFDISTPNGLRTLIYLELRGVKRKLWTGSKEMTDILKQISSLDDGFPFITTIIPDDSSDGGIEAYCFS